MGDVANTAQKERHHPEWSNVYNTVFIRWTTHHTGGLTDKDVNLASICDDLARPNEVPTEGEAKDAELVSKLEDCSCKPP